MLLAEQTLTCPVLTCRSVRGASDVWRWPGDPSRWDSESSLVRCNYRAIGQDQLRCHLIVTHRMPLRHATPFAVGMFRLAALTRVYDDSPR